MASVHGFAYTRDDPWLLSSAQTPANLMIPLWNAAFLASALVHVLDTYLQAPQTEEYSSFFCLKRFHQLRNHDLLIPSQIIIECLLCARPRVGDATSF